MKTGKLDHNLASFYTQPVDPIYSLHPKKGKKFSHLSHPRTPVLHSLDPITILHLHQTFSKTLLSRYLPLTLLTSMLLIYYINPVSTTSCPYYT